MYLNLTVVIGGILSTITNYNPHYSEKEISYIKNKIQATLGSHTPNHHTRGNNDPTVSTSESKFSNCKE